MTEITHTLRVIAKLNLQTGFHSVPCDIILALGIDNFEEVQVYLMHGLQNTRISITTIKKSSSPNPHTKWLSGITPVTTDQHPVFLWNPGPHRPPEPASGPLCSFSPMLQSTYFFDLLCSAGPGLIFTSQSLMNALSNWPPCSSNEHYYS